MMVNQEISASIHLYQRSKTTELLLVGHSELVSESQFEDAELNST